MHRNLAASQETKKPTPLEQIRKVIRPSYNDLFLVCNEFALVFEETRDIIDELEVDRRITDEDLTVLNKAISNAKQHLREAKRALTNAHEHFRGSEPNLELLLKKQT